MFLKAVATECYFCSAKCFALMGKCSFQESQGQTVLKLCPGDAWPWASFRPLTAGAQLAPSVPNPQPPRAMHLLIMEEVKCLSDP